MVTNAGLVIRPVVGLLFLVAGILLLRNSASRAGAWMIIVGALLLLGSELYGVFTLRPFVGRNYDEAWYEQIATVDSVPQLIPGVTFVPADLENGERWPFAGQRFAAVVVTNYLHRPLFAQLEQAVDEGGALIYETFMTGNERYGRPSNTAYMLQPGELLRAFKTLTVVA